jgi:predicted PurR-regulated permease PerM
VAWAIILAYVTWPAYQRLRSLLRGNVTGSALLMTVILTAAFVVPVVWLIMLLRSELGGAYQAVAAYLVNGPSLMGSAAIATAEEQASATETAMRNQDDLSASMRYLLGFIRSKKRRKKALRRTRVR